MTDKPARVFIGQANKHEGKFGEYFTFRFGMATLFFEPSKTPGKFNAYIKESPPLERRDAPPKQDAFGLPDEERPF